MSANEGLPDCKRSGLCEWLKPLLESQNIPSALICDDGYMKYANGLFIQLFGYTDEKLFDKPFSDLLHPDSFPKFQYSLDLKNSQKALGWDEQVKFLHRNGTVLSADIKIYPIPNNENECKGYMVHVQDITERKLMETEIQQNELRLNTLLELSGKRNLPEHEIYMFILDRSVELTCSELGLIGFVDEARDQIRIYAWSQCAMKECQVDNPTFDYRISQTGIWGDVIRLRKPLVIQDYTREYPSKKGLPIGQMAIRNYLSAPLIEDNHVIALIGVANKSTDYHSTDIRQLTLLLEGLHTILQQKQHERDLHAAKVRAEESEYKVRTMFENSLTGFLYFNTQGEILEANPAVLKMFNSPSLEMSKKNVNLLTYHPLIEVGFSQDIIGLSESVMLENPCGFGLQVIDGMFRQFKGKVAIERDQESLSGFKFRF